MVGFFAFLGGNGNWRLQILFLPCLTSRTFVTPAEILEHGTESCFSDQNQACSVFLSKLHSGTDLAFLEHSFTYETIGKGRVHF